MLFGFRMVALAALVAVTVTSMAQAQVHSRLRGDTYTFSATNFPGDIGETEDPVTREIIDHGTAPVQLTFDGIEEVAGGMRINERAVQFDGIDGGIFGVQASGIGDDGQTEFELLDWELPGEVIEFSFQTVDGGWVSDDQGGQSALTMRELDWQNTKDLDPFFFEQGFYFYYSSNGTPVSGYETQQPEIGLLVGDHPFDSSIPEVVYIAYSRGQVDEVTQPFGPSVDLTFGSSQLDEENGSWALLTQVMGLADNSALDTWHLGFLVEPPTSEAVPGDVNLDGILDASDFDEQARALREGLTDSIYDHDNNGVVNAEDRRVQIEELANTYFGDSNFDGQFDSSDFVFVFIAGEYEDGVAANSTWTTGDWDGNAEFDSGDFVIAFQAAGFEQGPRAATPAVVPEPSGIALMMLGLGLMLMKRRR